MTLLREDRPTLPEFERRAGERGPWDEKDDLWLEAVIGEPSRRIAETEPQWADFLPLLIDDPHLDEWARLSTVARTSGVSLNDNELWIAATAGVGSRVLVTCDRDHVRIAPELAGEVVYLRAPV